MMDVQNDQEFIYAVLERLSSAPDLAQAIQAARDALAKIQEEQ